MFTVDMLPAQEGDCLWVEWGDPAEPHRMLIDAGRSSDYRLPTALRERIEALPPDRRVFDLVVATHMDVDHVQGLVPLFHTSPDGFRAEAVWFNGLQHLPGGDELGTTDADLLAAALTQSAEEAWNASWTDTPQHAVVVPDGEVPLPVREIAGLEITLLSPTLDTLAKLRDKWPASVREAGLDPRAPGDVSGDLLGARDPDVPLRELARREDDEADPSVSNRSSIAFLARYDGRTVLFGADAHADVLAAGLARVAAGAPVEIDVCKVPHHGSRQNVKPAFLRSLGCTTWLMSTDGSRHSHPDRRAMARLLTTGRGQTLVFNYRTKTTLEYGQFATTNEFGNTAHYPRTRGAGVRVEVSPEVRVVG